LQGARRPTILVNLKTTFNIRRPGLILLLAAAATILFLVLRPDPPRLAPSVPAGSDAEHLVAILQYLESDYPSAVASGDQAELAEQRSLSSEAVALAGRLQLDSALGARVTAVDARVRAALDAPQVSADCISLVDDLVASSHLARAPNMSPDLERGAHLFALACAPCHGASGRGDGPAATGLNPKPASFHSDDTMGSLTPFKAQGVIRFGVKGTAMVPFDALDEKDRWALAFYVFTLRQPPCDHAAVRMHLDELANSTDADLGTRAGDREVACLRRSLPTVDPPMLIAGARSRLETALRFARQGDARDAEGAVLDAYLTDIEPIEPWLRARDPEVVAQMEALFTTTRAALRDGKPDASENVTRLMFLLERAAGARAASTKLSVFWFSLLVITREGFEATVIIAALLAVLKKRKQERRARWVHAGWISALAVGAAVFALGRKVIAGALSEKMEGYLAFVAVAMLLHAAIWLNARTTTRQTMGKLRDQARVALDGGALALFGIAFLAMFRETFETAVFLEALSIDAPSAVAWGAGSGVVLLLGLVLGVSRLGLRLPMRLLFQISTAVLVVTAIMLLGQGIHSFEEVGILPSSPTPFVRLEFLGIYPDRLGLLAQLALSILIAIWKVFVGDPKAQSASVGPPDHARTGTPGPQ
jgi:high-affinity iron transporter